MKIPTLSLLFFGAVAHWTLFAQATQLPPPSQMKTLGLIGGTSWYSTVDYYRFINQAVNDAYGDNTNPPLLIYNMDNQRIHELQRKGQWNEMATLLAEAAAPNSL